MARRRDPSKIVGEDFFVETDALRERFARLIGSSDPQRVAIIPAVSYGIATAARNVSVESGQNIVILGDQFPSNVYVWMRKAKETGAELRVVERSARGRPSPGASWNRRLLRAIDRKTAVVATPIVSLGGRHPLRRRGDRTAGPRNRSRLRDRRHAVDRSAAVRRGGRWRPTRWSSPPTRPCSARIRAAWCGFGERFDEGVPLEEPWAAREGSDRFVAGRIEYVESYRPGALRYDVGERSNQIQVPMLNAALDMVLEWGPQRVQEYCESLLEPYEDVFREAGFELEDRAWRGAHLFGLRSVRGLDTEKTAATLRRAGIFVSVRGEAIRVAPQVYNGPRGPGRAGDGAAVPLTSGLIATLRHL